MRCCILILVLSGASCLWRSPHKISSQGPFGQTVPPQPKGLPQLDLSLNLEPAVFPDPLRVGRSVVVALDPVLASGTRCYSCEVTWRSTQPTVADWEQGQKSGNRQSAVLRPASPGAVSLVIDVCPAVGFQCERVVYRRQVVR
jgi:hypothetical protein